MNQKILNQLNSDVGKHEITTEYIKNTFDISPGLKINSKTIFRPIS